MTAHFCNQQYLASVPIIPPVPSRFRRIIIGVKYHVDLRLLCHPLLVPAVKSCLKFAILTQHFKNPETIFQNIYTKKKVSYINVVTIMKITSLNYFWRVTTFIQTCISFSIETKYKGLFQNKSTKIWVGLEWIDLRSNPPWGPLGFIDSVGYAPDSSNPNGSQKILMDLGSRFSVPGSIRL